MEMFVKLQSTDQKQTNRRSAISDPSPY